MKPIEITDANFQKEVVESPVPVLVDFWAVWCGPCRAIAPILEELAAELRGRLTIAKVNVDDHQELATRFRISSIPTLLLFRDGEVVKTLVGALPKGQLKSQLEDALK